MTLAVPLLTLLLSVAPDAGTAPGAPEPFRAEVSDPLLTPVPPPAVAITTWEQARDLLRRNSTDERSAAAGVERSAGRWRQALGTLLPNLGASGTVGHDFLNPDAPGLTGSPGPSGGADATRPAINLNAGISQSLIDLSAWRGMDAAGAARRSAEASLSETRRRLTLGLARGLVSVLAAERVAELNRLGLTQALERVALTQRTQELGAATRLDLVRIQQDAELARGTLVAGDEQLLRTRDALALALGVQGGAGPTRDFQLSGLLEELRQVCRAIPWEARPDLVAARENTASAEAGRRQATASYLPSLRANSNLYGFSTDPGVGRLGAWSIAAVLTIPLWDGGSREGVVQERAGALTQAEAAEEDLRRQVEIEVVQAARRLKTAEALLTSATQARTLAAETDALTRRAFQVGRGSSLELVQTAQALRQADVLLATREFELVQARLDAYLTEAECNG